MLEVSRLTVTAAVCCCCCVALSRFTGQTVMCPCLVHLLTTLPTSVRGTFPLRSS